jgi:superfamily II DNA/RNA helicase
MHILDQPHMQPGDGPIGLILCPTRELAGQIYSEAKHFGKLYNIRVCAIYGGAGKWEMQKALKESPEIVVATPGRLLEMLRMKATNLQRVTMVVLDEADRMFEMGFEYQMRSIVMNTRPDRQTLLFSATMKKKVEGFASEILHPTNTVRIVVGKHIGQSNPDINQQVHIVSADADKWRWLASNADDFVADGKVLIFVSGKAATEELCKSLNAHFRARQLDIGVEALHGDKDQSERSTVLKKFMNSSSTGSINNNTSILVATDIASRGLDIQNVRTVVNYDVPKNIETYVHRIGRTGRMGKAGVVPGTAHTLLVSGPSDANFAVDLVHNLRLSSLPVNPQLQRLAETCPRYNKVNHMFGGKKGGSSSFGGAGSVGSKGGLGSGFGTNRAMTSAMMAAESRGGGSIVNSSNFAAAYNPTASNNNTVNINNGYTVDDNNGPDSKESMEANPYIEGRSLGRGKHLTQPAWALAEQNQYQQRQEPSVSTSGSSSLSIQLSLHDGDSSPTSDSMLMNKPKRPSRFSSMQLPIDSSPIGNAAGSANSSVHGIFSPPPAPAPSSTPLKGFVRASAAYSSINTANSSSSSGSSGTSSSGSGSLSHNQFNRNPHMIMPFSPKEPVLQDLTPRVFDQHGQFATASRTNGNGGGNNTVGSSHHGASVEADRAPKRSRWNSSTN